MDDIMGPAARAQHINLKKMDNHVSSQEDRESSGHIKSIRSSGGQ